MVWMDGTRLERYIFGKTPVDMPARQAEQFARIVATRCDEMIRREVEWAIRGVHPNHRLNLKTPRN